MRPHVLIHCDYPEFSALLRNDARVGLNASRPRLPARWCFDGRGRWLFDRLLRRQSPHLWSAEADVLTDHADQIASMTGARHIVHIGPRSLWRMDALATKLSLAGCLSTVTVCDSPHGGVEDVPSPLPAHMFHVERHHLVCALPEVMPALADDGHRLLYCPSTVFASLDSTGRHRLLTGLRKACDAGDHLLLAAPQQGVPAGHLTFFDESDAEAMEFNSNVINVFNHTLDSDLNEAAFSHTVDYDTAGDRLELRLRARTALRVEMRSLGFSVDFDIGTQLRTFTMRGFSPYTLHDELDECGFKAQRRWRDPEKHVQVVLAAAS